ncbi:SsgA family sporulation/cell division regulator [Pseudonocardia hispaniensis]|uniref:SsgA family sporulation/cell division regulator n=1 Tax=Pseudonocardia hispaniensis TaxID=904933 RepID=A0ABW1IYX5_9PSEU
MRGEYLTICSSAIFELITSDAPVVPVNVELSYSSRDPYAVQATFQTGGDSSVRWVFARDLLADGLVAEAGTGDVKVQPLPHDLSRIELELTSPSGHAVFTTCAAGLAEFLDRTFEAVPPGSEYSWLDFDAALSNLLANHRARD